MWVLITVALAASADNDPRLWGPFTETECVMTAEAFKSTEALQAQALCVPLRTELNGEYK